MSTDTQSRAAAALDLPAGATTDAAAGAFLAALPSADFMPSSSCIAAVNVLAGSSIPFEAQEEYGSPVEPRELVDDFVRRFWSLDPKARTAEWHALSCCEEADPVRVRLMSLQPGLELPSDPFAEPLVEEVAKIAREFFLLPQRTRAIRRNAWLLQNVHRRADLVCAANSIRRLRPALVKLEPQLFARLDWSFDAVEFAAVASLRVPDSVQRVEMAKADFVKRYQDRLAEDDLQHASQSSRAGRKQAESGGGGGGMWWIAIVVAGMVLRGIGALSSNSNRTPNYHPPDPPASSFKMPIGNQGSPRVVYFSPEQIKRFNLRRIDSTIAKPVQYDEWVLAGGPDMPGAYPVPKPPTPRVIDDPDATKSAEEALKQIEAKIKRFTKETEDSKQLQPPTPKP